MAEEFAEMGLSENVMEEANPEDIRPLFALALASDETIREDLIDISSACE
jgi:hypothetical protein